MIRTRISKEDKKSYQAIIRVKGYPNKVKTFPSKRAAQNWEIKVTAAMKSGIYRDDTEAQKRTLACAIDRFLNERLTPNSKNYATIAGQLSWWKGSYGKYALVRITPELICQARDDLSKRSTLKGKLRSPATVNRYLSNLSVILSLARNEWGWIQDSPMKKVRKLRESRGRVRFLDDLERERLLQACQASKSRYLYQIVVLALSTGMRLGEILNLKWRDLDLDSGRAILHETKNGERRAVALTGHAFEILKNRSDSSLNQNSFVFPNQRGNAPITITSSWKNTLKASGIHDFRFHDLRHSAASYLAMNKATPGEIAEVLGHKTLAMVKRYAHLSESYTKNIVFQMNEIIFGKQYKTSINLKHE